MAQARLDSENGWRPPKISVESVDTSKIPGTNVSIPLQKGSVSRILKAFAADFSQYVEGLRQFDCGGWTPTNSVATSNHLNGTAMDLNWQLHPMGRVNEGFSGAQILTIRELLAFYEGMVYWGNDWNTPKDAMHFQMGYGTYQNNHVQDFINRKIGPDGRSTFPSGDQSGLHKPVVPGTGGTFWNDVSQYQVVAVDDSYPHRVFAFRTNSGDQVDTLAAKNIGACINLLNADKLDIVIAYYFFRPGQANCDLHRKLLELGGLWNHSRLISMVDVEGDRGSVAGDNSWEINDEVTRMMGWYGNRGRVIGYWNPNADPGIWLNRPYGLQLVIPQYGRGPGDLSTVNNQSIVREAFAHQFTSSETNTPPWQGRNVDVNWTPYEIPELFDLFGIEAPAIIEPDPPQENPSDAGGTVDLSTKAASASRYRGDDNKVWTLAQLIQFIDARSHEAEVERMAIFGHLDSINLVVRQAKAGDLMSLAVLAKIPDAHLRGIDLSGIAIEEL